jgi:hypothetical protein
MRAQHLDKFRIVNTGNRVNIRSCGRVRGSGQAKTLTFMTFIQTRGPFLPSERIFFRQETPSKTFSSNALQVNPGSKFHRASLLSFLFCVNNS